MKIAINALTVFNDSSGGATYIINLVKNLTEIDHRNTYYLFLSSANKKYFDFCTENVRIVVFPINNKKRILSIIFEQLLCPYFINRFKIDILISPGSFISFFSACKQVFIIHSALTVKNIRKIYDAKFIPIVRRTLYDILIPLSLRKADKLVVVSNSLKNNIMMQYIISNEKMHLIYEGVDFDIANERTCDVVYPKPYILFVSNLYSYKNAGKLIRAFSILKKNKSIPHYLVIVGSDRRNEMLRLNTIVKEIELLDYIVFAGGIPHERLGPVYKNAEVFVYPSSVESFGLPILEAMVCGIPVIASNRMSVPEVAGDAALIVNPDNIEELAEAINSVVSDSNLKETLIEAGYKRAKYFSWKCAANEMMKVIDEVTGVRKV